MDTVADTPGPVYSSERAALGADTASTVAIVGYEHLRNASGRDDKPARCYLIVTRNTSKPLGTFRTLLHARQASGGRGGCEDSVDDRSAQPYLLVVAYPPLWKTC